MTKSLHARLVAVLLGLLILLFFITGAYGRNLDEIKRSGKIYVAFTSTDVKNINYDLADAEQAVTVAFYYDIARLLDTAVRHF